MPVLLIIQLYPGIYRYMRQNTIYIYEHFSQLLMLTLSRSEQLIIIELHHKMGTYHRSGANYLKQLLILLVGKENRRRIVLLTSPAWILHVCKCYSCITVNLEVKLAISHFPVSGAWEDFRLFTAKYYFVPVKFYLEHGIIIESARI